MIIDICCAVAVIGCVICVCMQHKRINILTKCVGKLIENDQHNEQLWKNQISVNNGFIKVLENCVRTEDKKDD